MTSIPTPSFDFNVGAELERLNGEIPWRPTVSASNREAYIRRANILNAVEDRADEVYEALCCIRQRLNVPAGADADAIADIRTIVSDVLGNIHRLVGVDDLHGEPL